MEISSGIILYRVIDNNDIEFFMCTPDGPYWKSRTLWCFPKGHMEGNETPFETALREFEEETSVKLVSDETKYNYLGFIKQNKKKNVHIFIKEYENENLENCYSNLCVSIIKGEEIEHREIKGYKWVTLDEYKESGIKAYIPILEKIKNDYNN